MSRRGARAATLPGSRRRRRVEELFRRTADLAPERRRAVLDRACAGAPGVRREVDELLAADRGSEAFLEAAVAAGLHLAQNRAEHRAHSLAATPAPGLDRSPAAGAAPLPPPAGTAGLAGPYRLLREIGWGGMGRVFLAERADGAFDKRVAVKLLPAGTAAPAALRRFETERRILARLEHPHIARLYDGGTTEAGQPFFAMELVEGEPVDRFCDRRGLGVAERLRLFASVCRAVHHAHQNLVVHRDLKPSNVLVTAGGEPKLLDFGIATLLEEGGGLTGTALRPLTPGYASPEQLRGEPVTTASDVYSLGVVLYRLLAGRGPFDGAGASPARLERRALEGGAPPPSAAAERPELRRRLRGDLDTVVARAMAVEPHRRYASAEQLALDLERHLDGHPVAARPPTAAYRLSRFLRRHRWPTAVAVGTVVLLLAFAVTSARQSARIAAERDRAERVSAVLVELFQVGDVEHGASVTAREILDRGAARIRSEIGGPTPLRARLLEAIAGAYRNLGLYARAEPLLAESVELRRGDGQGGPELAETLDDLGVIRALQGDYAAAEPLMAEALALRERHLAPEHPLVGDSLNNLALVRHDRGDYAGAEPLYRRALRLADSRPEGAEGDAAVPRSNLALLLHDLGRYEEAEERFRRILEDQRRRLGVDHPALAPDLGHLGRVLQARGRLERAEAAFRKALELAGDHRPQDHPELARARHDLGTLLGRRGALDEGEALIRRALEVREAALGPDHPETAASRSALGEILAARGELARSRELHERAVASFRAALPPDHPSTAEALLRLGRLLAGAGRCGESFPVLSEARESVRRTLGPDDWRATEAARLLEGCDPTRGEPPVAAPPALTRRPAAPAARSVPPGSGPPG